MNLTPREKDKLLIAMAAMVARRRLERGVKLNHPEAMALITDFILEGARDGRTVAELMEAGAQVLTPRQVMDGIRRDDPRHPGRGDVSRRHQARHRARADPLRGSHDPRRNVHQGRRHRDQQGPQDRDAHVANTGDRPIQVGSHYHFFETNPALKFDRKKARGMRLDIPAGTAVRFEPGQSREVTLVALAGNRTIYGFRQDVMGKL